MLPSLSGESGRGEHNSWFAFRSYRVPGIPMVPYTPIVIILPFGATRLLKNDAKIIDDLTIK